jgi:hypothetical protein
VLEPNIHRATSPRRHTLAPGGECDGGGVATRRQVAEKLSPTTMDRGLKCPSVYLSVCLLGYIPGHVSSGV